MRHLLVLLCLAALPVGARAAEGAKRPRLIVLDVRAVGQFDPQSVAGLSALLATEAARHPLKVVAGSDLRALIGLEQQRQLLGCSDASCLAQIGGALGFEYLLSSEVSELGGRWLLTTTLLNVARSAAAARVTRQARSIGELVDQTPAVLRETLEAAGLIAPQPKAVPVEAVSTQTPPAPRTRSIVGFSLIGVGVAALAGGIAAGAVASKEHSDALATPPATEAALADKKSSIDQKLWIADGLFIGAAVAAGTGLVVLLTGPSSTPVAVGVAPSSTGAALHLSGRF